MDLSTVVVCEAGRSSYPELPPFHPDTAYPEYPFSSNEVSHEDNPVYAAVREAFILAGMDAEHLGAPDWNPLREIIRPGDRVLLKPNFVLATHDAGGTLDSLVTHGSVIRAILDYVHIALEGEGHITIGDAPLQKGNFAKTCELRGIDSVASFYSEQAGRAIDLCDFRLERVEVDETGIIVSRSDVRANREDFTLVDLGKKSFLDPVSEFFQRYRVTCYDKVTMARHHHREANSYLIPKRVLEADVVINLPKLKTHRKAGITGCLKNLVGINGHKDWLPHHRKGSVGEGGDEYPNKSWRKGVMSALWERRDATSRLFWRRAYNIASRGVRATGKIVPFRDRYSEGSWSGNDTIWRTILDLNRVLLFCDKAGTLRESPQRKYLALVDAVVAGEGEGPLEPDPKEAGLILMGRSPVAVDFVCAALMGFDHRRIPAVARGFEAGIFGVTKADLVQLRSNNEAWQDPRRLAENNLGFRPTRGWQGHIERDLRDHAVAESSRTLGLGAEA